MHRRTDINEFDIPKCDVECWERYPKHHWVYDLSRLLDAQNIKWSPFTSKLFADTAINMYFETNKVISYTPAHIFINAPQGQHILSEVYISKGEIKLIRYFDKGTLSEITKSIGDIELRINAFISMYFQKFSGVISIELIGNTITSIRLRPCSDLAPNADTVKLIKRIYKKNDALHIIGLADHVSHESFVS